MTEYEYNLNHLNSEFAGDDNREAAALNTLLGTRIGFGGKYTTLNGVEIRVADHSANMIRVNWQKHVVLVTVQGGQIRVSDCLGKETASSKLFALEQADDVYGYVESLCPEEVEE